MNEVGIRAFALTKVSFVRSSFFVCKWALQSFAVAAPCQEKHGLHSLESREANSLDCNLDAGYNAEEFTPQLETGVSSGR